MIEKHTFFDSRFNYDPYFVYNFTEKQKDLKLPFQKCHIEYLPIAVKILDRYRNSHHKLS